MKHLLSLLVAVSLLCSLCACHSDADINIPVFQPDSPVLTPNTSDTPDTPTTDIPPLPPSSDDKTSSNNQEDTSHPSDEQTTEQPPEENNEPYIRTIDPSAPMVALTFDDGPHELYSTQILDVLEQYHAVATFFEVGYNAQYYPDILRRMVELDCEIASHTNTHQDLTTLSRDAMLTDLAKLDQIVFEATGTMPTLVRPPYGAVNQMVKNESGRAMMLWTADTKDWQHRNTQTLIDYFMNFGDLDGEVVLMHSIHATTAEAMEVVVPWLIEQGYQLVTVSELMAYYYGELLEPNQFYSWSYFSQHNRTEFPLELPTEPMQTDIPPFTVVPVVPMSQQQQQPPQQPPEQQPEQPPVEEPPSEPQPPVEAPPTEQPPEPPVEQPPTEQPTDEPPLEQPPVENPETETPPSDDTTPPDTGEEPTLPPEEETPPPSDPSDSGENNSQ